MLPEVCEDVQESCDLGNVGVAYMLCLQVKVSREYRQYEGGASRPNVR